MTRKVERSALRQGLDPAEFSKAYTSPDLKDIILLGQNIELDERYAAGNQQMLAKAIPITRISRHEQQNRRPDGCSAVSFLDSCAKELKTWAVRCLLMRHTMKKHGLSSFAVTG